MTATLRKAFQIACSGRKGPVLIDIANNITDDITEYIAQKQLPQYMPPKIPSDVVEQVAKDLNNSKYPVIISGGGVVSSSAEMELTELSNKADVPVVRTLMPKVNYVQHDKWFNQIRRWQDVQKNLIDNDSSKEICDIMTIISNMAGDDAIFTTDVGQHQIWAAQYLHHIKPRLFLSSGGLGTMGFGYGAAIGACGYHVSTRNELKQAFNTAIHNTSPSCIVYKISKNLKVFSMIPNQWSVEEMILK